MAARSSGVAVAPNQESKMKAEHIQELKESQQELANFMAKRGWQPIFHTINNPDSVGNNQVFYSPEDPPTMPCSFEAIGTMTIWSKPPMNGQPGTPGLAAVFEDMDLGTHTFIFGDLAAQFAADYDAWMTSETEEVAKPVIPVSSEELGVGDSDFVTVICVNCKAEVGKFQNFGDNSGVMVACPNCGAALMIDNRVRQPVHRPVEVIEGIEREGTPGFPGVPNLFIT
jgi:DNA-directed RNA polymerase subunit RPC12/RpoP